MKRKRLWVGFILCLLLVSGGLIALMPVMAPVKPCTSATFWEVALNVHLAGAEAPDDWGDGTYPPRDGYFICYSQGYHGQSLFRVKEEVALADFAEVVPLLDAEVQRRDESSYLPQAYRAWLAEDESRSDAHLLLRNVRETFVSHMRKRHLASYRFSTEEDREFERRWKYVRRYWLNVVFELVYLNGLVVFAFWPWLRRKTLLHKCIHLGLLPFLLILPYHLGYASFTFTSAGPRGGVLYPLLIRLLGSEFWSWPRIFIDDALPHVGRMLGGGFPRPLLHISQPLGPMLSLSGGGGMDLVGSLCTGAVFGLILLLIGSHILHLRTEKTQTEEQEDGSADSTGDPKLPPSFWRGYLRSALKLCIVFLAALLAVFAVALIGPFTNGAFQQAAYGGRVNALRFALSVRPSLANAKDHNGYSALHAATEGFEDEVITLLLDRGADPNVQAPDGRTPLHWAAEHEAETIAGLLIAQGADVNATDHCGETPLYQASSEEIAALLIDHGAEVNAVALDGRTPLHFAASHYDAGPAKALLANGAELEARDDWDQTPLFMAGEVLPFLLAQGADPDARRKDGKALLHTAVRSEKTAEVLLQNGADVNALTPEGETVLDLVGDGWQADLVREVLLKYGAKTAKELPKQ